MESKPAGSRLYVWLGQLALVAAIFFLVQWWRADSMAGGAAPSLSGTLIGSDAPVDLQDYRGQPILVYFWATWCPVCRYSNGAINDIFPEHRVLTVALQSGDSAEILDSMRQEGINFPVIADPQGALASLWGVSGVPAGFILNKEGRISFRTLGYTTEIGLRARLWAADVIE